MVKSYFSFSSAGNLQNSADKFDKEFAKTVLEKNVSANAFASGNSQSMYKSPSCYVQTLELKGVLINAMFRLK